MSGTHSPVVAREGWLFVAGCAAVALALWHFVGIFWSLPFWALTLGLLILFRDPAREIPPMPLAVVAPADGIVTKLGTIHDPYLDREAIRISVQMTPWGVFSTRSPVEGKILEPRNTVTAGDTMPHGVWLQTDEGDDLVIVMNRGPLRNPPRCYVRFGERVGQGQRCGFIHLGARVDVYLPPNSRINVEEQQKVSGGSDVIATLVHK